MRLQLALLFLVLATVPAAAQGVRASPGLSATAPFVGVWEVVGDGRLYDVHHAGPFLVWITPADGSWVGSAHAVVGVAGPAARPPAGTARFTTSADGTVRLTLPDGAGSGGDGVAPLRDAPLRRVADAAPHDVALAAAFCDTDALAFARPGVRRRDETGGLRGIGPRADLRDAILTGLDLRGVDLSGADLSGAVLCGVDLSKAILPGARLDGAILGPAADGAIASIAGADFAGASLVGARLGGMDQVGAVFDRADLRGATIGCTPGVVMEGCAFSDMGGVSIAGADLRGAHAPDWAASATGGETARLDGAGFNADAASVGWLAASGLRDAETVILHPLMLFRRGVPTRFTGAEIRALVPLLPPIPASPTPGFDCRTARSATERTICAKPELAARDRALTTLWQAAPRGDAERAAQRAWLATRNACGADANCLADAYGVRLDQLATRLPLALARDETLSYSAEPGFRRPEGPTGALVERYLDAYGEPEDDITLTIDADGGVSLSGAATGVNGHGCSIEDTMPDVLGRRLTVPADPIGDPGDPMENLRSLTLIVADDLLIVTTQGRDFCGMRASWSDVYHLRR
jgi:uncharacterized protein